MTFSIEKPKTQKGFSYPLKSSVLKDKVEAIGLDCNVHLVYWTPQLDNRQHCSLIDAEYWLPNENVHLYRFYIRAGVVPSKDRKSAEAIFKNQVIDQLIEWMKRKAKTPINSTKNSGWFRAVLIDGKLEINVKE